MALNHDLIAFVKDGLQRGLARSDIEAVLLRAGWPVSTFTSAGDSDCQ